MKEFLESLLGPFLTLIRSIFGEADKHIEPLYRLPPYFLPGGHKREALLYAHYGNASILPFPVDGVVCIWAIRDPGCSFDLLVVCLNIAQAREGISSARFTKSGDVRGNYQRKIELSARKVLRESAKILATHVFMAFTISKDEIETDRGIFRELECVAGHALNLQAIWHQHSYNKPAYSLMQDVVQSIQKASSSDWGSLVVHLDWLELIQKIARRHFGDRHVLQPPRGSLR